MLTEMTGEETPNLTSDDAHIPEDPPPADAIEPEIEGTPMGVDADDEIDPDAQPGIPTEGEPPASE